MKTCCGRRIRNPTDADCIKYVLRHGNICGWILHTWLISSFCRVKIIGDLARRWQYFCLQASVQKLLDLDLFQLCLHLGQFHGMAEHRKTYIVKQTLRCMAICTKHHTDLKRQRTIWSQVTASLNNPEKTLRQRFAPTDMRYGSAILKIYWSTWLWVFEITAVEYPLPRDMNLSNLLESRSAIAVGRRNRCSRDCGQSSQGTSETEICWGTEVLHLATCIELTHKSTYLWITCITKRWTYVV